MEKDEIDYLVDLYMTVEFDFIWNRYLEYFKLACVDGEDNGIPKMTLNDYIEYKKKEYAKLSFMSVKEVETAIFNDVMRYYDKNKNNPDLQREIHKRIYNSIIDDLIQVQRDLAPEIREIYDNPRYVITPFKKIPQ